MKTTYSFKLENITIKGEGADFRVGEVNIAGSYEVDAKELHTIYTLLPVMIKKIYDVVMDLMKKAGNIS